MAIDLVDQLKRQLEGSVTRQLASRLGESEQSTQSGIAALTPATFAALLRQVSAPGGADRLNSALADGGYDGSLLDDPATTFSGDGTEALIQEGGAVASKLWSDGGSSLISQVGKLTGMKRTSVQSLLSLLTPLAMSLLGQQKSTNHLDASGLSSLLMSQKESIHRSLPAGLSVAEPMPTAAPTGSMDRHPRGSTPEAVGRTPVLYFLIPLALLAAIAYGCYWFIFDGIRPGGAAGNVVIEAGDIPAPEYEQESAGRGGRPAPAPASTGDGEAPANPATAEPSADVDAAAVDAAGTDASTVPPPDNAAQSDTAPDAATE